MSGVVTMIQNASTNALALVIDRGISRYLDLVDFVSLRRTCRCHYNDSGAWSIRSKQLPLHLSSLNTREILALHYLLQWAMLFPYELGTKKWYQQIVNWLEHNTSIRIMSSFFIQMNYLDLDLSNISIRKRHVWLKQKHRYRSRRVYKMDPLPDYVPACQEHAYHYDTFRPQYEEHDITDTRPTKRRKRWVQRLRTPQSCRWEHLCSLLHEQRHSSSDDNGQPWRLAQDGAHTPDNEPWFGIGVHMSVVLLPVQRRGKKSQSIFGVGGGGPVAMPTHLLHTDHSRFFESTRTQKWPSDSCFPRFVPGPDASGKFICATSGTGRGCHSTVIIGQRSQFDMDSRIWQEWSPWHRGRTQIGPFPLLSESFGSDHAIRSVLHDTHHNGWQHGRCVRISPWKTSISTCTKLDVGKHLHRRCRRHDEKRRCQIKTYPMFGGGGGCRHIPCAI